MFVGVVNGQPPNDLLEMSPAEAAPRLAAGALAHEALVRFRVSGLALDSFFNVGEIAGCSAAAAALLVDLGIAERVTLAERNAAIRRAYDEEAERTKPEHLVHLRALISCCVAGSYYSASRREVASFPAEKAKELLGWRTASGEPFFVEVPLAEMEVLWAEQERHRQEQAAVREKLTLVEFLISFAVHGCYYNKGERAAFAGEQLAYLLDARTANNEPFVKKLHDVFADDGSPATEA